MTGRFAEESAESIERGLREHTREAIEQLEASAERAAEVLKGDCPGLQVVGTYAGSPLSCDEDDIVARIVAADPDVLLVAYGAPRQDLWIHRNLHRLGWRWRKP